MKGFTSWRLILEQISETNLPGLHSAFMIFMAAWNGNFKPAGKRTLPCAYVPGATATTEPQAGSIIQMHSGGALWYMHVAILNLWHYLYHQSTIIYGDKQSLSWLCIICTPSAVRNLHVCVASLHLYVEFRLPTNPKFFYHCLVHSRQLTYSFPIHYV